MKLSFLKRGKISIRAIDLTRFTSINIIGESDKTFQSLRKHGFNDITTESGFFSLSTIPMGYHLTPISNIPSIVENGLLTPDKVDDRLWESVYKESLNDKRIQNARDVGIYFWTDYNRAINYRWILSEDFPNTRFVIICFQLPKEMPLIDPELGILGVRLDDFKDWREFVEWQIKTERTISVSFYTTQSIGDQDIGGIIFNEELVYYNKRNLSDLYNPKWSEDYDKFIEKTQEEYEGDKEF
jgi:hypothetical protein